ncbi:uncharacterized protein LOC131994929 [Stomoxys calcitrans]|uniref:uncharacterized protein LOC131994929 n=1 Tax=Stomoxys calcitrans TaxID=35570 RepID=UPI0027E36DFF|nr:uncharacterized protein LOC131994929 [Stomoxys calcitrans]
MRYFINTGHIENDNVICLPAISCSSEFFKATAKIMLKTFLIILIVGVALKANELINDTTIERTTFAAIASKGPAAVETNYNKTTINEVKNSGHKEIAAFISSYRILNMTLHRILDESNDAMLMPNSRRNKSIFFPAPRPASKCGFKHNGQQICN